MKPIKVLVVDDHAIVRAGLRSVLKTAEDIQIVGEAENGRQAVFEAKRLRPDVILLDLAMPVLNGLEAARQIANEVPAARVLVLSSYSDCQHVQQAVEAGVAGYLMKEACGDDLLHAIRLARDSGASFSPPVLKHLLRHGEKRRAESRSGATRTTPLSSRQAEVLQLVAEGYGNKQIAGFLSLSKKTVEKHRQSLMEKLNLHKTATLTRYAVCSGIVELGQIPGWRAASPSRPNNQSHLNSKWRTV